MPNSFLRRASAPGGEASSATQFDEPLDLKSGDTLAVPEKLPSCRPVSYRNTQPRTVSFRPSRFIKGATPSLSTGSTCPPISDDMQSFIHAFDLYSQKVYIEGYLFRHIDAGRRTRCFAELCGSTLSVWDAEVQTPSVMPQYVNISDATVHSCCDENGGDNKRKYFVVNGTKTLKFEATDETTMSRWMCAIRLACFEKKRLHLLFTLKLLLESYDPAADIPAKWDANLQVCTAGSEWQKCRVTINDRTERRGGGGGIFGGGSKNKSAQQQQENHQLAIYDTKKSKVPYLTVTDITHAYAVYPESPQLITKSCIMRVEGSVMKKDDKQPEHGYVLIMADNCQQMSAGLLAIYDKFKLYGRPESLTTDPTVETALNYGVDPGYPGLFLDLEDVLQCNDVKSAEEPQQVERALLAALHKRLSEPIRPGTGARANSLPLITVAFEDKNNNGPTMRQRAASGDEEKPRPHSPYKLSYQVADSSDESDDDQDDEDNDEEVDSDDEPIGKSRNAQSKQQQQQQQQRSLAESLIPDFDFDNGFDVSQRTQSSSNSSLFEPSDDGYTRSRQTSISITKESTTSSTNATTANNYTAAKEQSTTTSSSSLFGDFSLSLDFPKFDERKYSLPASVKLSEQDSIDRPSSSGCGTSSSGSSILDYSKRRRSFSDDRRARSTDLSYWGEDEYAADEYAAGHHHHRHSYDVESDADLDDDAPIIPSLNDHFAPQNSLLDKYLGDQLTAKEQIEYCRATGQPLIQVSSNKPEIPDSGFVGMISRREKERKEGNYQRVSERVQRHHADRSLLEREKERRLFDQRQQQWMKHQMMLYHNGYMPNHPPMPMMYPPYMGPPPPPGPLTPISPLSPNPGPHPHYMMPPPGGMYMAPAPHMRSGPRSPSISSPVSPGSRRSSRPLLDDIDDELMLSNNNSSPSNHIHPISRAASPVFRKSEQI